MKKSFYFTLTQRQGGGHVEVIASDYSKARERMVEVYGLEWAFQYESLEDVHLFDRIKKAELRGG